MVNTRIRTSIATYGTVTLVDASFHFKPQGGRHDTQRTHSAGTLERLLRRFLGGNAGRGGALPAGKG